MKKSYSAFLLAVFFILYIPYFTFADAEDFSESQTRNIREKLVQEAKNTLKKPYEKGKRGAESFDEAGFINYCYANVAELFVPVTVRALYDFARIIPDEEREIGDILFFTKDSIITDAGIYIGNGEFISCSQSQNKNEVAVYKLNDKYWKENFNANGKILKFSGLTDKNSKSSTKNTNKSKNPVTVKTTQKDSQKEPQRDFSLENINSEENEESEESVKSIEDKIFFTNYITGDWSLFSENRFMINFRGLSAQSIINYQSEKLTFGTGFMLRWNNGVGAFQLPILLSVNILDFIKVYSGPVFTIGNCYTPITNTPVEASIFPGILGITFYLPSITKGDFKIQFIQDINFSIFNYADGSALPLDQTLTSGLELSTGISVTFPLSIFIY